MERQCESCQEEIDEDDIYFNLGRYMKDPNEYYCQSCGLEVILDEFSRNTRKYNLQFIKKENNKQ